MTDDPFRDAVRFWERWRRIGYNIALLLLCAAWVGFTWPHFQPAFGIVNLLRCLVLAALANA